MLSYFWGISFFSCQQKEQKDNNNLPNIVIIFADDMGYVVAAPDHWHPPAAVLACKAGKHVYLEKPGSHNPGEGDLII